MIQSLATRRGGLQWLLRWKRWQPIPHRALTDSRSMNIARVASIHSRHLRGRDIVDLAVRIDIRADVEIGKFGCELWLMS